MKIASWNVNSLRVRLPQVLEWLQDNPVDILVLQETKMVDEDFPVDEINQGRLSSSIFRTKNLQRCGRLI